MGRGQFLPVLMWELVSSMSPFPSSCSRAVSASDMGSGQLPAEISLPLVAQCISQRAAKKIWRVEAPGHGELIAFSIEAIDDHAPAVVSAQGLHDVRTGDDPLQLSFVSLDGREGDRRPVELAHPRGPGRKGH